jgi:hypothetical protein
MGIYQRCEIALTARVTVDVEAACHMRVSWRLSAPTAEGAASDSVPRLRVLKIGQVAAEVVRQAMALTNSLIASFELGRVVWNRLGLRDNGGTFSGIDVFDGSLGVFLEPLPKMNKKRLRIL